MPETLLFERDDRGIVVVTLNRPDHLNAYDEQMGAELVEVIADVARDEQARVLVITGAGKAFCAGADMRVEHFGELVGPADPGGARAVAVHATYRRLITKIIPGLHGLDIPTIASVPGPAIGVGCDLALACDLRICSEKARFSEAWVSRGAVAASGGTWLLPRLVGLGLALELLFTGRIVEAEEAMRIGLVNRIAPVSDLRDQTMVLARSIAKQPPIALKLAKINAYRGLTIDLVSALELAGASQSIALSTRDHDEAMAAWHEKREPKYIGR